MRHDLKNILVCKWIPLKCFRGQFCKKCWPASRLFREKSSLGITQLMFKPDASLISSEARKIHKNAPKNRLPFQELPLHTDFFWSKRQTVWERIVYLWLNVGCDISWSPKCVIQGYYNYFKENRFLYRMH